MAKINKIGLSLLVLSLLGASASSYAASGYKTTMDKIAQVVSEGVKNKGCKQIGQITNVKTSQDEVAIFYELEITCPQTFSMDVYSFMNNKMAWIEGYFDAISGCKSYGENGWEIMFQWGRSFDIQAYIRQKCKRSAFSEQDAEDAATLLLKRF